MKTNRDKKRLSIMVFSDIVPATLSIQSTWVSIYDNAIKSLAFSILKINIKLLYAIFYNAC